MPWHQEPMKDVISCDKLRVGAHSQRSEDFRMRKLTWETPCIIKLIHSLMKVTQGTETSKYLEEEKEKSIFLVAASERERAQTKDLSLGLRTEH